MMPWDKPAAALPMPWEAPKVPEAPDDLVQTVKALQADVRTMVSHTGVIVHATGPHAAALGMLVNTTRGQLIPPGEVRYSGGHTLRFQDLGMPQPGAPFMTIPQLVKSLVDVTQRLGLELEP
jgi:hypothetical protein